MFKFQNYFFVSVIFIFVGCASLPPGKTYRDVAIETFPQTTHALETATQVSTGILPPPYAQVLNVLETLSLLGLGIFAVNKHKRISRIETVLNGNLGEPKISAPSKS